MTAIRPRPEESRRLVLSGIRWCLNFLLFVGALAVGYAAYVTLLGQAYQTVQLRKFNKDAPLAEPRLPLIGEAIGKIQIPSLGLQAVILHGDSNHILRLGIGHVLGTPMPGEPGNVALAGHRDTFFRSLQRIQTGDLIIVRTGAGTFRYQVQSTTVVSPGNVEVLCSSNGNELTLITCFPFDYVGAAPKRFIVRATEIVDSKERSTNNLLVPLNGGSCADSPNQTSLLGGALTMTRR